MLQLCQVNEMGKTSKKTGGQAHALSKHRIVATAIEILDTRGEGALTFRVLSAQLSTGSGAIYWHVSNKQDLLSAATNHIVARTLAQIATNDAPEDVIRFICRKIFDMLDTHPWVGSQLSRNPGQHAVTLLLEQIGRQIEKLGVHDRDLFNASTAIVNFILGLAGQYAATMSPSHAGTARSASLERIAARWAALDQQLYPFVNSMAAYMSGHDDREQFLAGINLLLTGIKATHKT
nr:TetR/AcrR family transcriptional regulator C-terminal domain-containing protein [Acetobacter persici]